MRFGGACGRAGVVFLPAVGVRGAAPGLFFLPQDCDSTGPRRVSRHRSLPRYLTDRVQKAGATLNLQCEVTQIGRRRGSVQVEGRAGAELFTCQAPQALISLPLGVLQAGQVCFDPGIPTIDRVCGMARCAAARLSLLFRQPFWQTRAPGPGFLFARPLRFSTCCTSQPNQAPRLTGWAGGHAAAARLASHKALGKATVENRALEDLSTLFSMSKRDRRTHRVSSYYHDWQSDPWSRGAYSYARADSLPAADAMSQPLGLDTLFCRRTHGP